MTTAAEAPARGGAAATGTGTASGRAGPEEPDGDGGGAGAGSRWVRPGRCRSVHGALLWFAGLAVAGALVRWWTVAGAQPVWWQDSGDYLGVSGRSLLSLDLWAGSRPVAAPLLLKLVGGDGLRFVQVQVVVAALCWATLAVEVTRWSGHRWARAGLAAGVLGFSLAEPLTMWDRSILSESLALSTLALVVAALLHATRRPGGPAAVMLVLASAAWCATRDTHAWVVLLAAAGFLLARLARRWWPGSRRPGCGRSWVLVGGAVGSALVAVAGILSAGHGGRSDLPLRNVYQVRVLPYEDRVAWFADRGMPRADRFLDGTRPPFAAEGRAPITYVGRKDPAAAEWSRWVGTEGESAYRMWLLTHPTYLVTEPFRTPERAFNNARGDRSFYAPRDQRVVPLMAELFLPPRPLALAVGAAVVGVVLVRRRDRSALLRAAGAVGALALPHAALSWHADGMETARHLTVAVVQFHLGVLLLVAGLAAGAVGAGRS